MSLSVTHSTPSDGTFSGSGATAWDAAHTISNLSAVSKLVGSSSASAAVTEITLGTNLSMSGSTLSATNAANSGPTFPGGVPLSGVKYPAVYGSNLATGDNDLYTVPANKRALVLSVTAFNTSAGTISYTPQVKVSGTYYPLTNGALTRVTGSAQQKTLTIGYIAEAGEIVSVKTATTNGLNVWFEVVEFDNTSGAKSAKVVGLSSGNNTIYTVPSSTSAIILDATGNLNANAGGSLSYSNVTGATRTYYWHIVPSGQSVGSGYQVSLATNTIATGGAVQQAASASLATGDFVNINVDAATAGQMAWVNILEIT